jgi:ribulose-phosphate 3-epimerase
MPITLSASILSADFADLAGQIHRAETAGTDWIHIDVMDGHFVPVITMGPFIVEACRRITRLPLDVHLMIERPEKHLEAFAKAGASTLTVHVETCPHLYHTLQTIRALGCHPGVVINPGTPSSSLASILHLVDMVLIMTVNPGASGQVFIPETLPKVREVSDMISRTGSKALIEVDGGISTATLPEAYKAGARIFVAATTIFKNPQGIAAGIEALRRSEPG